MAVDHLLTDPCTLVAVTVSQDTDGAVLEAAQSSTETRCYMEVLNGDESDAAVRGQARFWLPRTLTPAGTGYIDHATGRWEIDGAPEPARNPRTQQLSHWVINARQAA